MLEELGEKLYNGMQKIGGKLPQTDSVALQGVMYGGMMAVALVLVMMMFGGAMSCSAAMGANSGGDEGAVGYVAEGDDMPEGAGKLNAVDRERVWKATVVAVLDGDTLGVELSDGKQNRVRLIGIDTPESVHPDESRNTEEGVAASDYTKSLVHEGDTVWLTGDVSDMDRYERWLRYVWLEDPSEGDLEPSEHMLNAILVRDGYAKAVDFEPDTKYSELFHALEDGTYVPEKKTSASSSSGSAKAQDEGTQSSQKLPGGGVLEEESSSSEAASSSAQPEAEASSSEADQAA